MHIRAHTQLISSIRGNKMYSINQHISSIIDGYRIKFRLVLVAMLMLLNGVVIAQFNKTDTDNVAQMISARTSTNVIAEPENSIAPLRTLNISLSEAMPFPKKLLLTGINELRKINFSVRQDEVVTNAMLKLTFTPSPSLVPAQSHIKVYLNDELMGVIKVAEAQLGKESTVEMPINPIYFKDFNKLEFELISNYESSCVNKANPVLWLNINKEKSVLELTAQQLLLKDDLAYFPHPFFDPNDSRPFVLPMVFPKMPSLVQQRAAGILASWFGVKAMWRSQSFPVSYDTLPKTHAIVFGTNENMPAFLSKIKKVSGPTIEIMAHPEQPYNKILLVLGRDDEDLVTAVKGIAQGNLLFRGQSIAIDRVEQLSPRQPYDAPNWIRIDRPMLFSELQEYPGQLDSVGRQPDEIRLNINVPPDLFMIRNTGIDIDLKYRYSAPVLQDQSRLVVNLNQRFVADFVLRSAEKESKTPLRLPLLRSIFDKSQETLSIPALKMGSINQLQFEFVFSSIVGSSMEGICQTQLSVDNHGSISDQSTIDFSGYRHYIEMPDLHAFSRGGFPFSRLADLSETVVLISENPSVGQLEVLLNTLADISAQTGYPSTKFSLVNDWSTVEDDDIIRDILLIGSIPAALLSEFEITNELSILIDEVKGFIKEPTRKKGILAVPVDQHALTPDSKVTLSAQGSIAAIIGIQSPFDTERSVVAFLANDEMGYDLINDAFNDADKREAMFGSVIVLRDSGMEAMRIGDTYKVGHLPWWELIWHHLTGHPVVLAFLSVFAALMCTLLLWRILRALSYRRLSAGD